MAFALPPSTIIPSYQTSSENWGLSVRKFGPENAKLLHRRLDDLRDAESLEQVPPEARCHELKGRRAGQLAIDLKQPYRLVFEVADDPVPIQPTNGGLDWKRVRSIRILEVVDYHD